MAIGRFRKLAGRCDIHIGDHRGLQNRAPGIDNRIKGGRPMARSWWVAEMAIGRFVKRGGRCAVRTRDHMGPKIAHESTSAQSKAGGRWRTFSGWPKWASYDQLRPLVINCGQLRSIVVI